MDEVLAGIENCTHPGIENGTARVGTGEYPEQRIVPRHDGIFTRKTRRRVHPGAARNVSPPEATAS